MKTKGVDQVGSFLMALIVLSGSTVAMMFLAWMMTPPQWPDHQQSTVVTSVTFGSSKSAEREFEQPAEHEITELVEPTLEQTVQQVTNVPNPVKSQLAMRGSGEPSKGKIGSVKGDELLAGPRGALIIPEYLRWELRFAASSEKQFAKQLEDLKIDLAAFGGGLKGIDVATAPFDRSSARRIDDPTTENRLYFSWNRPTPLQGYQRSLMRRAGIVLANRNLVKFIAPELEKTLADKELEYARKHGGESVKAVAKTVFECQAVASGYDFVVIDQRYRQSQQRSLQELQKPR